jgi:hypothetical protein
MGLSGENYLHLVRRVFPNWDSDAPPQRHRPEDARLLIRIRGADMPDGERQAPQAILGEGLAEREPAPPLVAGQGSLAPARPPTASTPRAS